MFGLVPGTMNKPIQISVTICGTYKYSMTKYAPVTLFMAAPFPTSLQINKKLIYLKKRCGNTRIYPFESQKTSTGIY